MDCFLSYDSSNSWIFIWLEQLCLLYDYSRPSEHGLQGQRQPNGMPMSRHPNFGATMERLRHKPRSDTSTQIFDLAGYILVTEQSKDMVTEARLPSLTTFSTSFVISIQSRPSALSEIHMFCRAQFPISFPFFFLCLTFDCVEEGKSRGVNSGGDWG